MLSHDMTSPLRSECDQAWLGEPYGLLAYLFICVLFLIRPVSLRSAARESERVRMRGYNVQLLLHISVSLCRPSPLRSWRGIVDTVKAKPFPKLSAGLRHRAFSPWLT